MADLIDLKRQRQEAYDTLEATNKDLIAVLGEKDQDGNYQNLSAEDEQKRVLLSVNSMRDAEKAETLTRQIDTLEAIRREDDAPHTDKLGNVLLDDSGNEIKKFANSDEYLEKFTKMIKASKTKNSSSFREAHDWLNSEHKDYRNFGLNDTSELLTPACTEEQIYMECAKESCLFGASSVTTVPWHARNFVFGGEDDGPMAPTKRCQEICVCEPSFAPKHWEIYKFACMLPLCNEIIDDAFGLSNYLAQWFARKGGITFEEYGFKGANGQKDFFDLSGNPKEVPLTDCVPLGLENEDKEHVLTYTTEKPGSPKFTDLIKASTMIKTSAMGNARWIFPKAMMVELALATDANNRPLWLPDYVGNKPGTFCGYPVCFSDYLPGYDDISSGDTLGYFGDFSNHRYFIRRGISIDSSTDFLFANDMTAIRALTRWTSGVFRKKGIVKLVSA